MEEEEEGKEKDESEAVSSVMSDNESLTWVREGRGKRGGGAGRPRSLEAKRVSQERADQGSMTGREARGRSKEEMKQTCWVDQ